MFRRQVKSLRQRGAAENAFTLVEIMVVVAIVGILAYLAVPRFLESSLKAKRSEVKSNLRAIANAELAYFYANGEYIKASSNPGESLDTQQNEWDPTIAGWDVLGWAPTGGLRCNYSAQIYGSGTWFRIDAYCDLDSDNKTAITRYYGPKPDGSGSYFYEVYPDRY